VQQHELGAAVARWADPHRLELEAVNLDHAA
jgi:hypothetical protein